MWNSIPVPTFAKKALMGIGAVTYLPHSTSNFREVGWEFCDRMLMDGHNGFAGVIVGMGTTLAIGGANPHVYYASNLLSGYIGNSFNVLYGTINTARSAYRLLRSRRYQRAVDLPCMKPAVLRISE
ncbi:hypothetical protein DV736_g3807, partial [Chaetothyriales sp. CBS 134916]